jgi:arginase
MLVGVAGGHGAGDQGCQDGPEVLRLFNVLQDLDSTRHPCVWDPILHLDASTPSSLAAVRTLVGRLASTVQAHLINHDFPLVIGGDHSCAIGTWSGVRAHLDATLGSPARLGLIWVDAHMDSHTLATSPSKNLHGMPLACLLGHGDPALTAVAGPAPRLLPQDVCLIGVRSFEWGEADLLMELGVRVYFMEEVQRRGFGEILAEARSRVATDTAAYGISIDMDAFDPEEEAGVGTPVAGGLHRADVADALAQLNGDRALIAMEVVEYNPYRDTHFATAAAIHDLIQSLIAP